MAWKVIVDDRLQRSNEERQTSRHQQQTHLQDIEFADDAATIATTQEFPQADRLLDQTFSDWNEKLNRDKTETLILAPNTRPERRARNDDAPNKVRYVGGLLTDRGTQWADTTSKCLKARQRAKDIAKAWSTGTAHGRGRSSRVKIATRLKVMRSVVVPTLVALGRSRAWTNGQIAALQAVQTYALQRCFGLDRILVRDHRITTEQLHKAAQSPMIKDVLSAATLRWVGHVARMPTSRLPKQGVWGFWMDGKIRNNHATTQVQWISAVLKAADIHKMHWFKLAQNQDYTKWDALIVKAFPKKWLTKEAKARLNRWRPGMPLPDISLLRIRQTRRVWTKPASRIAHTECPECEEILPNAHALRNQRSAISRRHSGHQQYSRTHCHRGSAHMAQHRSPRRPAHACRHSLRFSLCG